MCFWVWRRQLQPCYFLTVVWLLLATVHNIFVGKIFSEVPLSSWICFGGELTEFCPHQTLLSPTSPPQADRKKYLPVRGSKTEMVCFYFLTLLKTKSSSWLPLLYAGMCINFNTSNICHWFILFLIIFCSVCAGKTWSPGLLWLDNHSVWTSKQTVTALFLKVVVFLPLEMWCFVIDAKWIRLSWVLFSSPVRHWIALQIKNKTIH